MQSTSENPPEDLRLPLIDDWIGKGKTYKNVPDFVAQELLQRLAIPDSIEALLPSSMLSVRQLLAIPIPPQIQPPPGISPLACFSETAPNVNLSDLPHTPIPPNIFVIQLRRVAGQAMLDGQRSIKDWSRADVYLPFSVISIWSSLLQAVVSKIAWQNAEAWLAKQKECLSAVPTLIPRINYILASTSWKGRVTSLGSFVDITDMALFLSPQMLSESHIDAMLSRLRIRIQESLPSPQSIVIALTDFTQSLTAIPSYENPYPIGATTSLTRVASHFLNDPTVHDLWAVAYSEPVHFGALHIQKTSKNKLEINWGDSIQRSQPKGMTQGLETWVTHHAPGSTMKLSEDLECTSQTDAYSCSIISVNTIKHALFGDVFWSQSTRETLRVQEFLDIMEYHSGIHHSSQSHDLLRLPEPTILSELSSLNTKKPVLDNHTPTSAIATPIFCETSSAPPQPKPPPPASLKRRQAVELVPESGSCSALDLPATKKKKAVSRSAVSKAEANKAILDGTFVRNAAKWANYKDKLKDLDVNYAVDEHDVKRIRLVHHSVCAEYIKMSAPYDIGRFKEHLNHCTIKKSKMAASNTKSLFAYFQPNPSFQSTPPSTTTAATDRSSIMKLWPCPGLTQADDVRIKQYLQRTVSASAGGISERVLAKQIYDSDYSALTPPQKKVVDLRQIQTHRWRLDHIRNRVIAIGSCPCAENVPNQQSATGDHLFLPCEPCRALLSLREFQTAISKPLPANNDCIFVPRRHQNAAIGEIYAKTLGLRDLLSEESSESVFRCFARQFAQGKFDDDEVFTGLVEVMVLRVEREDKGRGMQNMTYPPAFDEWCHELQCLGTAAYESFRRIFGGRSECSFLHVRSSKPSFMQGIGDHTHARAIQYLEDYGYPLDAPLAISVDDTKLLPAFKPYYDGLLQKWFVVGGTGDPIEVADIKLLEAQIKAAEDTKASKLRLWMLTIPLPNIPPCVLAASPISSKTNAVELGQMEEKLLRHLINSEENLNIVTLASDGTTVEREVRRQLIRTGFAESVTYLIPHPQPESSPLIVELYKVGNRFMVPVQDSKHFRKTARNNLFTGARILTLGRHVICYQQVREMAFSTAGSPLYIRDVHKLDRQDDRAAARLFSASTLEFLVERCSENVGLMTYLFVFGELADAYQSRTASHSERVKMALRAKFFKDQWKMFLREGEYALNRHFISKEADDIIDILVNGVIGHIYVYRDALKGRYPLLLWMKASESNEHSFGFFRELVPDFTMLDVLRLVPKIGVRLMAACKRKMHNLNLRKTAAGYSHTYSDADTANLRFLATFPTDEEITDAAKMAFDDATMLWELLGYYPLGVAQITPDSMIQAPVEEDEMLEGEAEEVNVSDRQELQDALDTAAKVRAEGLPSDKTDNLLDKCVFAAASFNLTDFEEIEKLPENDPETLEQMKSMLANMLAAISAQGSAGSAAVQELLASSIAQQPRPQREETSSTIDTTQMPPALSTTLDVGPGTDLSHLVRLRYQNQSKELAKSVRTAWKNTPVEKSEHLDADIPPKPPSERQLLARKIHEILRLEEERGSSSGLNRQVRWKTAAGSASNVNYSSAGTGNTANAQMAARASTAAIIKRRRKEFSKITLCAELATAKVDMLSKLVCGSYGIVVVDNALMIGKILTMYKRGGGKTAYHGWISEADSIGSVSYLPMQVWQHHRQRMFRGYFGATMRLNVPRYAHIPAAAFLHYIPTQFIHLVNNGDFIELNMKFFEDVYSKLDMQKALVVDSVKRLLVTTRKKTDDGDGDGGNDID
ncbi:hypothetical protein BJ912DRAFT_923213 [Pholiota molesta]|nr:hypothetical protein BJ912DRAFT_923213 [Pholiota molesta]